MRGILETHFRCATCGAELKLIHHNDIKKEKHTQRSTNSTSTPGGCKVEFSVYVEPCENCLQPLKDAKKAFATLNKLAELDK